MRFGQFGREDNSLVLISQGGTLTVKILRRGVVFEPKDVTPGLIRFYRQYSFLDNVTHLWSTIHLKVFIIDMYTIIYSCLYCSL